MFFDSQYFYGFSLYILYLFLAKLPQLKHIINKHVNSLLSEVRIFFIGKHLNDKGVSLYV